MGKHSSSKPESDRVEALPAPELHKKRTNAHNQYR
jgi:hypothetical protein